MIGFLGDIVSLIFPAFGPVVRRKTVVVATTIFWTLAVAFAIVGWWPAAVVFAIFGAFATLMLVALHVDDRRAKRNTRPPT